MFRVWNETAVTQNSDDLNEVTPDLQRSDQLWWLVALFIIIVLAFLCFLLRKSIFRCFQKEAPSICQRDEERDPESGAQMKLRPDESVSLNQSESEHLNDSVSRG
ncbi:hypothetical protein cypCar_00016810 [Cyprinus carpio]|nr:hypothetical protein cypCar_00016810 [Cyprinus carpio]